MLHFCEFIFVIKQVVTLAIHIPSRLQGHQKEHFLTCRSTSASSSASTSSPLAAAATAAAAAVTSPEGPAASSSTWIGGINSKDKLGLKMVLKI